MRISFIVLMIILVQAQSKAQDWEWVDTTITKEYNIEYISKVEAYENDFFVIGTARNDSNPNGTGFIMNVNLETRQVVWFKTLNNLSPFLLSISNNRVHIGCDLIQSTNFEGYEITPQKKDAFLASFDFEGNVIWYYHLGTPCEDYISSVINDNNNNLYVCGITFSRCIPYGYSNGNIWLKKISNSGELEWTLPLDSTIYFYTLKIGIDNNNNIILSGLFTDSLKLKDSLNSFHFYDKDFFLASVNPFNQFNWVKAGIKGHPIALVVNNKNEILLVSLYSQYFSFENYELPFLNNPSAYNYILKLDDKGKPLEGTIIEGFNTRIRVDDKGSITTFSNVKKEFEQTDIEIIHQTENFKELWRNKIKTEKWGPVTADFAIHKATENIIIGGSAADFTTFQNSNYYLSNPEGIAFLAKIENSNIHLNLKTYSKEIFSLSLYPNPTSSHFTISFEAEKADVTITDFSGRHVMQCQVVSNEMIDTSGFLKGIYLVQVKVGEEVVRRKLIIK